MSVEAARKEDADSIQAVGGAKSGVPFQLSSLFASISLPHFASESSFSSSKSTRRKPSGGRSSRSRHAATARRITGENPPRVNVASLSSSFSASSFFAVRRRVEATGREGRSPKFRMEQCGSR
ncbi:hypothetical protein KM043_000769 [Ampulex compressa]|nr:hypothetical protein KM043_000769 [Ampulex compressa]